MSLTFPTTGRYAPPSCSDLCDKPFKMRYRINLSYDGAPFCGWQKQNDVPTVEGTLEAALAILLGAETDVVGAGRTDTGVNASFYVAHFDSKEPFDARTLCYRLNAILPKSIAVQSIEQVDEDFHARFGAKARQYRYYIHRDKDPFRNAYSWHCRYRLDAEKMNEACKYLIGKHDCKCFEKTGSDNKSSICDIMSASWQAREDGSLVFTIRADRFLRNMVRAIVGTMVDIGRGVHEPEYISVLLENGTRSDAGQSVPGNALFLCDIRY